MKEHLSTVRHDYIRYANCWEDAYILLEALKIKEGDKVLSIGSAGDNSFSLLVDNPQIVVAVDVNKVQLYLIELKKEAFRLLDYKQFIQLLGFVSSSKRIEFYNKIKSNLSKEAVGFWDSNLVLIGYGIIYQGKFEKYFEVFRTKILPLTQSKKDVNELFKKKSLEKQKLFFDQRWNNWRWRLLFKVFFGKFILGRFGRDSSFLNEVKLSVGDYLLNKTREHFSSVNCQGNHYVEFTMKGKFESELPHYAREENFDKIKFNIDKLKIHHGLAEDVFTEYGKFDKFNLSNIFEYMNEKTFFLTSQKLIENGNKCATYAYWNLMVPRKMSEIIYDLEYSKGISTSLSKKDKCFYYSNFIVEVKK